MANRSNIRGVLTLLFVGGVYLYRNRATIMRYLDQAGIKLPEQLPSGVQNVVKQVQDKVQGFQSQNQDKLAG